jgi:hypothetical protein
VETSVAIGFAMTDYLLAAGTNKAPASNAPAHMAAWIESRGYRLVRSQDADPADPGDPERVARIAAAVDWRSAAAEGAEGVGGSAQHAIVRQVLAAISSAATVGVEETSW